MSSFPAHCQEKTYRNIKGRIFIVPVHYKVEGKPIRVLQIMALTTAQYFYRGRTRWRGLGGEGGGWVGWGGVAPSN